MTVFKSCLINCVNLDEFSRASVFSFVKWVKLSQLLDCCVN